VVILKATGMRCACIRSADRPSLLREGKRDTGSFMEKREPRQIRWSAKESRAREELLRPSRLLGYDHDRIGIYCLSRDSVPIAEVSFRRAIWLNPYEPRFLFHLAQALFRKKDYPAVLEQLDILLERWPGYGEAQEFRKVVVEILFREA